MSGLSLGGSANGQSLTTGSAISVKVTDNDGAVATDSYGVTWHLPNENWVMSGPYPHPKLMFPKAGYTVFNKAEVYSHEPNRTINFEIPHPTLEVSYLSSKSVLTNGSLALGVGAAGIAVWAAAATGVAVPVAIGVFLAATVGAGMQVSAGNIPNPTLDTQQSDYDQFKEDMRLQKQINDARALDPNAYPGTEDRCGDSIFVDAAVAEIERIEQLHGTQANSGWDSDDNFRQFNGILRCTAKAGRYRHREEWDGDEYDEHGYSGSAHATIIRPLNVFYVYNWTFVYSNPGSGGSGGSGGNP